MTARAQLTESILAAKSRLGLTWATIAQTLGPASPILYTAALLGQATLTPDEAAKAATLVELTPADANLLAIPPNRGEGVPMPPTGPLIYRFYELIQNYGQTWKELIHEEFGEGIMSAIDFNMSISREPNPAGENRNVRKFLPYKRF